VNPKNLHFGFDIDPKKSTSPRSSTRRWAGASARPSSRPSRPSRRTACSKSSSRATGSSRATLGGSRRDHGEAEPGDPLELAPQLASWLAALGDLPGGTLISAATYDDALVDAGKRFQSRHGLATDGVIGPATSKALAVPAAARVRQIELALERLRWIPALESGRVVFVNIPAFELWAFDGIEPASASSVQMAVVVGRALRTQTPVFTGVMKSRLRAVLERPAQHHPQRDPPSRRGTPATSRHRTWRS
jgi:murein L,D-transpeptidase YcbB/YkuD